MQKNLNQLKATCNWLIFLEIFYMLWSLIGLCFKSYDPILLSSLAFYCICIFLFVRFRNSLNWDIDETSLPFLKPTDVLSTPLIVFIIIIFGFQYVVALYWALVSGSTFIFDNLFYLITQGSFNSGTFYLYLVIFVLSMSVVVAGGIFFARLNKFKRLPTLANNASN